MLSRSAFLWLYIAMSQTAPISHIHLPLASLIITFVPGLTLSIVNSRRQPLELRVLSPFQECLSSQLWNDTFFSPLAHRNRCKPWQALPRQIRGSAVARTWVGLSICLNLSIAPSIQQKEEAGSRNPSRQTPAAPVHATPRAPVLPPAAPAAPCQSGRQQIGTALPLIRI